MTYTQARIIEIIKGLRDCYEDWTDEYKECERALCAVQKEFSEKEEALK